MRRSRSVPFTLSVAKASLSSGSEFSPKWASVIGRREERRKEYHSEEMYPKVYDDRLCNRYNVKGTAGVQV